MIVVVAHIAQIIIMIKKVAVVLPDQKQNRKQQKIQWLLEITT